MGEFMLQNEVCLLGGEVLFKRCGEEQDGLQHGGDSWALNFGRSPNERWVFEADLLGDAIDL